MKCTWCNADIGNNSTCQYCGSSQPMRRPDLSGVQAYGGGQMDVGGSSSKGSKEMEETTKNMAKPQFKEATALFGKTVKALLEGGPQAAAMQIAMEGISKIFEIFAPLIEILSSPLEVITGILQLSLVPLIQQLAPMIGQFNIMLIQNKDSIIAIVQVMSPLFMGLTVWTVLLKENEKEIKILIVEFGGLLKEMGSLALIILEDKDVMFLLVTTARALAMVLRDVIEAIRFAKNLLSGFRDILNSLKLPGGGGGGGGGGSGGGISIPGLGTIRLPGMAEGGYVPPTPGGTLALLGEGGEGEHIIPDSKMGSLYQVYIAEQTLEEVRNLNKNLIDQRR